MEFFRILLIVLILIIFTIAFIRLINQRNQILAITTKNPTIEGMGPQDEVSGLKSRYNPVKIVNTRTSIQNLPLRELCIKSSYSSAWSGSYVSTDMIKLILSRGYRYLDIPIYYGADSNPYAFYSTDVNTVDTNAAIPLDNVFNVIASSAFSNNSPNPLDPLFIELRITPDINNNIYNTVANLIQSNFQQTMYLDSQNRAILIDGSTPLNMLMGRTIFIMNSTKNPNFASSSQPFAFSMNAVLGETPFILKTYDQIPQQKDYMVQTRYNVVSYDMPPTTNIRACTSLIPEITELNPIPNIYNAVRNFGIQVMFVPFYTADPMIMLYEQTFDDEQSAFVPMAKMLINATYYFQNKNPRKSQIPFGFLSA
jgi:hypothetical protein